MPTTEPASAIVRVSINDRASPSPSAGSVSDTILLPTPLVSGVELTRPDINIGSLFVVLIGLACVGYMAYLCSVMIRK